MKRLSPILLFVFLACFLSGCGMRTCWDCKGRSFCSRCGGDGNCDICGGTGHVFVDTLNDYVVCATCGGDGECVKCDGNKVCPTCKGRGKLSTWGKWRADYYDVFQF